MGERSNHQACVDAWFSRRAPGCDAAGLIDLFNEASTALWIRSRTTLGEVTLTAIAERVILVAIERHPFLEPLAIKQAVGIHGPQSCADATADREELLAGLRFVLVELLTVLGNLTANILTAELHAELSKVAARTKKAAARATPGKRVKRAMVAKTAAGGKKRRP